MLRFVRPTLATLKALGLWRSVDWPAFCFLRSVFFFAFTPAFGALCALLASSISASQRRV